MKLLVKNSYLKFNSIFIGLLSLTLMFGAILTSCSKDPGKIGFNIQPEDSKLQVGYTDTTTIYGYTKLLDSIRSDKLSVSAFGSLRDPVFGSTTAGIYTQFILSINGHDFGADRHFDSLVLKLNYLGYYGDTTTTLTMHTYEMTQGISKDSIYYSNLQRTINPTDYSNLSFEPHPTDSVYLVYTKDTVAPMLWVNLSNQSTALGEKLLNASVGEMEDSQKFQEYFKGLFIQSQPVYEDGSIVYFGLTTANTVLSLYYGNSEHDSLRYDYLVTTTTATVNKYEHDYTTADPNFKSQVLGGDTTLGAQRFYAQGYGGVQSIIKIPNLINWSRLGNIAINEAKLVLPGVSDDKFFDAPNQMFLLEVGEDGIGVPLPDQNEGEHFFDGFYNKSRNSYEFRITRYVQSLISDSTKSNNGLFLFIYGGSVHPERFIFKGNEQESDSSQTIKLELLYTDL